MTTVTPSSVLGIIAQQKNVLLYGPPGTGKTYLLANLMAILSEREDADGRPALNLGDANNPIGLAAEDDGNDNLPDTVTVDWVTFHQSYSYEEFVIGKYPVPEAGGVRLQPFFGLLMNAAIALKEAGPNHGHLIIIDELNRANASQVFGEFITLLDSDYRATIDGEPNPNALKIRLPGIRYHDGQSEPISRFDGDQTVRLPEDWTFPENLYILATMNSVDRAALPLDSALTRRFHKIEMAPNANWLAEKLDVTIAGLTQKADSLRREEAGDGELSAGETTVLLLDRLNAKISSELGKDFEIGHALFMGVVKAPPEDRWQALVSAWDNKVFPQLNERFVQNSDIMRSILKVVDQTKVGVAFSERQPIGGGVIENAPITVEPLASLDLEAAKVILRHLAV